jgi:sorting nexin-1/2
MSKMIKVHDPTKVGGVVPFILYQVTSWKQGEENATTTVERRYSDFAWLEAMLRKDHTDCIVPPLPPKQQLGRFEEGFIDARRRQLEKFLSRLGCHPQLSVSPHLDVFLLASDSIISNARNAERLTTTTTTSWFSSSMSKFIRTTKALAAEATSPIPVREANVQADPFDSRLVEVQRFDMLTKSLAQKTSAVVLKSSERSAALSQLAQVLTLYGQAEEDGELRVELMEAGAMLASAAAVASALARQDAELLEETLEEQAGLAESIVIAFQNRQAARMTFDEANDVIIRRQEELYSIDLHGPSLMLGSLSLEEQVIAKKAELEVAKKTRLEAKLILERHTERVLEDHRLTKTVLATEIRHVLLDFTRRKVTTG